ncbi:sensor histidine kinase [Yoonia sp. MH D7]
MDELPIINAFKHIQIPVLIFGLDGAILHCNSAAHRLLGYPDDELIGRPVSDILLVDSLEELTGHIKPPAIDAIIKGLMGRRETGKFIPLVLQLSEWHDANSGRQHVLVLRDITDDMKEARLAKNELARANSAITGAHIGVFEYNPVDDTVIVSDIWRQLLELDSSDTFDVQVEWRGRVHPEDLETALEPIRICAEKRGERANCEYRIRSRDGSRWLWMRTDAAVASRDRDGNVIRVIGAMTDITEQKTTENDLRRSVSQFRSTFDNAPIGMAIMCLDGRWLGVNPALCDLLGYTEEELLTSSFQSMTHSDDLDAETHHFELLKANSITSYQVEKRYIRASGEVMWGLLSVSIVKDADGNPDHFISQIVDVTEPRRLNDVKSEFVATVSHELRTPLTSVLGSLTLLSSMEDEPFSDEAQRLLFIAQENGKRLHALVNDILDFEKFSARRMSFEPTSNRIIGLIEEAVLANMAYADKYGVLFDIECKDRSVTGCVDPKRFHQVMANFLTNAAKFAETGSRIKVLVERVEKAIKVSVMNSGAGIPDAFRDQIFKPFSQAQNSSTRARGGTGLGLNIAKQIVEQTGGSIGFDSENAGNTTFWFTIPTKSTD